MSRLFLVFVLLLSLNAKAQDCNGSYYLSWDGVALNLNGYNKYSVLLELYEGGYIFEFSKYRDVSGKFIRVIPIIL